MFFLKSAVFLRKRSPRQGCTKPKTELGRHQNPYFQQNPLKINENPKINPPSTITIPEPVFCPLHPIGNSQLRAKSAKGAIVHVQKMGDLANAQAEALSSAVVGGDTVVKAPSTAKKGAAIDSEFANFRVFVRALRLVYLD